MDSRKELKISHYDFHDGCIIEIEQYDNKIAISMESAEVSEENKVELSECSTLKGKLHIEGVRDLRMNGDLCEKISENFYDTAYIFSFDIVGKEVVLVVKWETRPPKPYEETDFIKIELEAEKIWWENIPNLVNPYR